MKVAMITDRLGDGGGIDTYILEISKFYPNEIDIITKTLIEANVKSKNNIYTFHNYHELMNILRNYDIIHTHYFPMNFYATIAKSILKKKLVHTWHGIVPIKYMDSIKRKVKTILTYITHKIAFERSDVIISVSKFLQNQVKNSIYIPNGVDTKKFRPKRSKHEPTVIYVGALEKYRGVHFIPKWSSEIDANFILVGRGRLEKQLIGIKNIKIIPYCSHDKLPKIYHKSDVMIRPSLYEGFGIPVLEAMSCSIPVITSNFPCFREIVNERCGFIVPIEKFPEKIRLLLENKNLRRRMGREGRKIAKDFEWKVIAKKIMDVYTKLI
ncbi:MAG: glycosyltransferase family 4 protein [Candidatus Aenigmatarchaeota archaeon]